MSHERNTIMKRAILVLVMLGGMALYAASAHADQWPLGTTTAAYVTGNADQAAITPVRWYGYYRYPGRYWYPARPWYNGYRPYYYWGYPQTYYYNPGWDYGYYQPYYGFSYYGPRLSLRLGY